MKIQTKVNTGAGAHIEYFNSVYNVNPMYQTSPLSDVLWTRTTKVASESVLDIFISIVI